MFLVSKDQTKMEGIEEDDAFFQRMVDLIPPEFEETEDTPIDLVDVKKIKKSKKKKIKKKKMNEEKFVNKAGITETGRKGDCAKGLREKLDDRIQKLQGVRKKMTHEERMERRRLNNKNKKMRRKQKRRQQQEQKKISAKQSTSDAEVPVSSKPVDNKEGKIEFSKFDFSESGEKEKSQSGMTGKDYKRLLEKMEKKKTKMDQLKSTDKELSEKIEEKSQWRNAIHRAQGEKIHTDPDRLKKALKTKDKLKEIRKKKWVEREAAVEKRMAARQDKRTKNIQFRKDAKIKNKIKKAKKKGRMPNI